MTTTLANPVFDWTLLYVADPQKSAELYGKIFGVAPTETAPTFSMLRLPGGMNLGLWLKDDVVPKANAAGGAEMSFSEPTREAVSARAESFRQLGLTILQEPTDMDFGYTFTAADPDGHRLRVMAMPGA
jgi:predicted enzyme related to lactoylglutathione lyase